MDDQTLRTIRAGDTIEYVAIVEKAAHAVARRIPKPDNSKWTQADIQDLTSDFYASPAYQHAVLNAHNDESLRKLVYTGLSNLARAELRKTDRGRLHRRLIELLRSGNFIEHPTKFWRRSSDSIGASAATSQDLLSAAWNVEVRVVKWRPDAKRNSPFAEKSSLIQLLDALFDCAAGAVHIDVLVDVFGRRLGVGPTTATEDLDVAADGFTADSELGPAEQHCEIQAALDAAHQAGELWDQLSPRERLLVPHLAGSARKAAVAVGGGKSAVNHAMKRLKEKFRVVLSEADDDHRRLILRELLLFATEPVDS